MKQSTIERIDIKDDGKWRQYWFQDVPGRSEEERVTMSVQEIENDLNQSGHARQGFVIQIGTDGANLTMTAVYNKYLASGEYKPSEVERKRNWKQAQKLIDDFLGIQEG